MDWMNFIVTPLVGAIVGFGVWYFQSRIEEIRRARDRLNDERREVYSNVLEPFIRIFTGIKNPKENQKALQQVLSLDYRRAAFQFSLIGSDEVVKSFNNLMQYIYSMEIDSEKPNHIALLRLWGDFLLAIRRDVGNPETRLTAKDMLRNLFKDIDQHFDSQSA